MRPVRSYSVRCSFGGDVCFSVIEITISLGCRATYDSPAEPPELSATGCPHVDEASGRDWRKPGGIAEQLWEVAAAQEAEAFEAEVDRRTAMALGK